MDATGRLRKHPHPPSTFRPPMIYPPYRPTCVDSYISMASSSASSSAIRRLPVRQAISSLTSGEGSTSLPSRVKGLRLSFVSKNSPSGPRYVFSTPYRLFREVQGRPWDGLSRLGVWKQVTQGSKLIISEFVRTIAPRLAYANPTLPFHIDRLRDPRSKALDKKSPDAGVGAWEGGMPKASLRVEIGTSFSLSALISSTSCVSLRLVWKWG